MSPVSDRPTRRRTRVAEGVYKDRYGLAATVKVHGVQREIRFPPRHSAQDESARGAINCARACARCRTGRRHTLAHDADRYLDQVKNTLRVSLRDRRRDLAVWLPRFGHLRTLALPSHLADLNAQLHEWRRDARRVELQPQASRTRPPGTPSLWPTSPPST